MNRELVIYIVFDVKYYDKFKWFCMGICYVDEYYIFIMMFVEFWEKILMWSVMVVDWLCGGWYFGSFGRDDVEGFY